MYRRIIENKIISLLNKREILILYGPRRVGKTTILNNLKTIFNQKQHPCMLYTLDDPASSIIFANPTVNKLKTIFSELGFNTNKNYLLLDEVQSFSKIDILLKLIYDHFSHIKVIVTSSSSILLLHELTESLAGRKLFIEIFPLTLSEYTGININTYFKFDDLITKKEELSNILTHNFSIYGSYPEIVNMDKNIDKIHKLRDIIDSSLYKDIFIQEKIKAPKTLVYLVQLLAFQIGNLVNLNELSTQLGISRNTVNEYINILERFFIIFRLTPFEKNIRSEITSKFKVYFWDLGLRNAIIYRFTPFDNREDKGALFENIIISSILKRNYYSGCLWQPFFWRTYEGSEIDLVLRNILTEKLWIFQITTTNRALFSRSFDKYKPVKKIVVNLSNGYKYCM
ncbi:MAG: ATP-binding protein [bacterium]|nr:ATP-binding protein [bacterium]